MSSHLILLKWLFFKKMKVVEIQIDATTTENAVVFSQKISKIKWLCDPVILLQGAYWKDRKPVHWGDVHSPIFTTHSQDRKSSWASLSGWMDKEHVGCMHSGVLFIEASMRWCHCGNMEMSLEGTALSEISPSQKDKCTCLGRI